MIILSSISTLQYENLVKRQKKLNLNIEYNNYEWNTLDKLDLRSKPFKIQTRMTISNSKPVCEYKIVKK